MKLVKFPLGEFLYDDDAPLEQMQERSDRKEIERARKAGHFLPSREEIAQQKAAIRDAWTDDNGVLLSDEGVHRDRGQGRAADRRKESGIRVVKDWRRK